MTEAEMTKLEKETRGRRIIERLRMFNRKERDHLMKFALCEEPAAPRLSPEFWKLVSGDNGTEHPSAEKLFVGMDYHLNWIYAALASSGIQDLDSSKDLENKWECPLPSGDKHKNYRPIQRNQEDVDLLVAWFDKRWKKPLRIILIEAKLDSSWGSAQFTSKKKRLTLIREDAKARGLNFIDWRFLLLSPGDPPTKNGFNIGNFSKRHKWLLDKREATEDKKFWHDKLPVHTTLRRVERKTDSGEEWNTAVSLKTSKSSGNAEDDN